MARRSEVDAELDDEVRDYFERARTDLVREGHSAEQAAHAARRKLGDADKVREEVRAYGWENTVEAVLRDLHHAARRLRRSPGFALVGVLTLALGIGASTAIVSVVEPILFAPLPYPEADRVVLLSDRVQDGTPLDATYGTYIELAQRSRSFEGLAVANHWQPALTGADEPERLDGDQVSVDYFRVLGIAPAFGRNFDAADDARGGPPVAIVSAELAKRRFGSGRAALEQRIVLDGNEYTVIGIMPEGFENVLSPTAEVWAPLRYRAHAPFQTTEWGHHLRMIGRLAQGISLEQARREILAIGRTPAAQFPRPSWASLQNGLLVEAMQAAVTSSVRPMLLAVLGAVLLLLAIVCVNVTHLLLARGAERRSEIAMRAALGAARGRLFRQLLTESLLLALLGGAAGLGAAAAGVRVLLALAPAGIPRVDSVRLDMPAFLFALALTMFVGLAVGLAPALRGTRADLRAALQAGRRATGGAPHVLGRALVVAQVALAVVLLASAGLLLRSVERLLGIPPGFDASHVLTMQVVESGHRYDSGRLLQVFRQALDAVHGLPGVTDAAFTSQLPLSGDDEGYGVLFESVAKADRSETDAALRYAVTPGWFRTMRIPLLQGRLLGTEDRPGGPEALLISESFAKRRFGLQSPIGQRVRLGPEIGRRDRPWDVVVGVVGDVKQTSLALGPPDAFYVAMGQWSWVDTVQSLVVRTQGDAATLVPAVEQAIWSVDPTAPITRVATMNRLLAASEAERRFALTVFGAFAVAALVLAAIGLYGVLAVGVAERTREIGVRSALGASPGGILAHVLRQGMSLTGLGIVIGLAGAAAATRALASLLFGVTPLDPLTYACVIALLAAVSIAACWVPARRAARVDPSITLRSE
ncbi:MAG TPA: ABC transporter permease [Gammaproteobacteria bacterium]|nr:ABC transporter permease [Gammaproteobacteria bacterium]